jgi:hypothetical protein
MAACKLDDAVFTRMKGGEHHSHEVRCGQPYQRYPNTGGKTITTIAAHTA